ncbi:MAG: hypothetical protein QOE70_2530, partial [Chthoniobacter sp.]|nr:hypothetical protein [Chthoniobacter sp.]
MGDTLSQDMGYSFARRMMRLRDVMEEFLTGFGT